MKNYVVSLLLRTIAYIPFKLSNFVAKALGNFLYRVNSKLVRVCRKNLSLCYPDLSRKELEQLCALRVEYFIKTVFEIPKVWGQSEIWINSNIKKFHGLSSFESYMGNQNGLIIIIPHIGNWELLGLWISAQTRMTSIYEPPKIEGLNTWIKKNREKFGANLVPANPSGVKKVLKALKNGEVVGILPDQFPPENSGEEALFFEIKTRTMTLIHNLINHTNCDVLTAAALRVDDGWEIHFKIVEDDLFNSNKFASLNALNNEVQEMIKLSPEQYQWEYKRFKDLRLNDIKFYETI